MRKGQFRNLAYLKDKRRALRKTMTPAEAALWTLLQSRNLNGRRFRRQHGIGNYIVDFFCPSEKLVIELDGEVHNNHDAAEADYHRDEHLKSMGYTILRFENKLVFEHTEWVLEQITNAFKK